MNFLEASREKVIACAMSRSPLFYESTKPFYVEHNCMPYACLNESEILKYAVRLWEALQD